MKRACVSVPSSRAACQGYRNALNMRFSPTNGVFTPEKHGCLDDNTLNCPHTPRARCTPFFFSQLDGRRPCEKRSNYSTFYNMALCIRERSAIYLHIFLADTKKKAKMKQGHRPLSSFKHFTRRKKNSPSCPENNARSCHCVTSLVLKESSCTGN